MGPIKTWITPKPFTSASKRSHSYLFLRRLCRRRRRLSEAVVLEEQQSGKHSLLPFLLTSEERLQALDALRVQRVHVE